MLNKEKYAKEIIEIACNGGNIAIVNGKLENCRKTQCNECNFNGGTIRDCERKTREWANSEYVEPIEPPVDWSKVPVDTPILVRQTEEHAWIHRYFAKYENGMVYTWANGATSWSGEIVSSWMYAKLAESEEVNRILAEEEKTGGWIPVTERLPEESLNSIIGWDTYRNRCCFVQFLGGRFVIGDDTDSVNITAWMPLPEPYRVSAENAQPEETPLTEHPQTNADRIRSMTDEELAEWFNTVTKDVLGGSTWNKKGWLKWLRSESEG